MGRDGIWENTPQSCKLYIIVFLRGTPQNANFIIFYGLLIKRNSPKCKFYQLLWTSDWYKFLDNDRKSYEEFGSEKNLKVIHAMTLCTILPLLRVLRVQLYNSGMI